MSLSAIKIVLVEPSHPGNVGAVARAMKTMGLSQLSLVQPKKFPHYEATKRSAGGEDVLNNANVVDSLANAVADCTLVLGTSVRDREVSWPTSSPREAAERASQHLSLFDGVDSAQIAIVFGRESSGLTNAELERCHGQIRIDANPEYSSLNLASAVQILAYELRVALVNLDAESESAAGEGGQEERLANNIKPLGTKPLTGAQKRKLPADEASKEGHLQHLQQVLYELDFVKSESPTVLFRKLTRLYSKAELTGEEVQILRGILTAIQSQLRN